MPIRTNNQTNKKQPSNKSCVYRNTEPNLVSFYEDQQITEDLVEFPPGTELVAPPRTLLPSLALI